VEALVVWCRGLLGGGLLRLRTRDARRGACRRTMLFSDLKLAFGKVGYSSRACNVVSPKRLVL